MWPSISYETQRWDRDYDELMLIPRSRRRKILPTYESAVPAKIAGLTPELSPELSRRMAEVEVLLARFDQEQRSRDYNLPALMLRSESSSSSQIECLTSSARNIALAELTDQTPGNARLIAANAAAMRSALNQDGPLCIDSICRIHDELVNGADEATGLRNEQVWIGGTSFSPHGADFVPPHSSRVPECLDDLLAFGRREDVSPIAKAAVFHAQFETIHPFTDGNGRTGRALIHRMLADDGLLTCTALPISAGLLHNVNEYMDALDYYHEGMVRPIVEQLTDALELAVAVGSQFARKIDLVVEAWRDATTERKGSAAHRLPALLVEHPVVNATFVASNLEVTERAARNLIDSACEKGILTKTGNARRGAFYQASALLEVIEEASDIKSIRRMAR